MKCLYCLNQGMESMKLNQGSEPLRLKWEGLAVPGERGMLYLAQAGFFANCLQTFVEETQFRYQVTPAP